MIYDKPEDYVPESLENLVLELVEGGIKAVDLISKLTVANYEKTLINCNPKLGGLNCKDYQVPVLRYASADPVQLVQNMVDKKQIAELEYVLPNMQYRVKSMYFPRGTEFRR